MWEEEGTKVNKNVLNYRKESRQLYPSSPPPPSKISLFPLLKPGNPLKCPRFYWFQWILNVYFSFILTGADNIGLKIQNHYVFIRLSVLRRKRGVRTKNSSDINNSTDIDWRTLTYNPGLNNRILFYFVLYCFCFCFVFGCDFYLVYYFPSFGFIGWNRERFIQTRGVLWIWCTSCWC